jgi:hypothetical protein
VGRAIPSLALAPFAIVGLTAAASLQKKEPDVMRLKIALINHERMQNGHFPSGVNPAVGVKPMETLIAGRFERVLSEPVWSSTYARSVLTNGERKRAEQIRAARGKPSADEVADARAVLGQTIDENGAMNVARRSESKKQIQFTMWPLAFGGVIWIAFFSIAAALICRGGLLIHALGIAVVTRDGTDASRLRMLWRAGMAWSWLPLGGTAIAILARLGNIPIALGVPCLVVVILVATSAALPGRSLQDRLAGTWLVPR